MKLIKKFYPYFNCVPNLKPRLIQLSFITLRKYSFENFGFPERNVQIRTCGHLYEKWKAENRFRKLPDSDLTFNVKFIDTKPNCSNNATDSTVLAMHGAPGSWRDYTILVSHLHQLGHRVIVPSFPDFHECNPGIFRHTHLEKAQYIKDFLTEIAVSHIDLLVCHSGAVYPALNLCLGDEPKVKSLALLNPAAFDLKDMTVYPYLRWLKFMMNIAENSIGRKLLEKYGPFILNNMFNIPVIFKSVLDPLLSATTVVNGGTVELKKKIPLISKKLSLFLAFSENDPLFKPKASYEIADLIGAHTSDIFVYDREGSLVHKGTATPMLKVLAFQKGSHYVFLKHPEIINKEVAEFLELQKKLY